MPASLTVRVAEDADVRPRFPSIRVRPVPRLEPLTDDELREAGLETPPMTAPALPLELPTAGQWQSGRGERSGRRSAGAASAGAASADAASASAASASAASASAASANGASAGKSTGPTPASSSLVGATGPAASATERIGGTRAGPAHSGEAEQTLARLAVRRFLAACLEVVGGFRPVTHLRPLCAADRFAGIAKRLTGRTTLTEAARTVGAAHFGARTPVAARTPTGAPPRGARSDQNAPGDRVRVRRVQMCEPIDGVAEVAVVLSRREQVWAMALRLEHREQGWLCSHLDVLTPKHPERPL